ncbi:MAG TPA: DUF72 domain-containing protein [Ignavibacteria bacterium]|jgi:uncharacterized protein YecE (DUF72 family)
MDFGKVNTNDLNKIDFTLPEDNSGNKKILNSKGFKDTTVYIGCAKWGRTEWVGKIYPKGTKEKDFLEHYVKHFNSIELNATHYRIFPSLVIKGWAEKAGSGFKYCPKFPQYISHIRRLRNCEKETELFYDSISNFGEKLGACFLQMAPNFAPKSFNDLKKYLEQLPKNPEVCLELRHPGWFADPAVYDETFSMLIEGGIGSVITDAAGRRDLVHMRLSNKTAFIRFVGNSLHPSDYTRIDDWVKRLKKWMYSGLNTLYFFMHMHDERYSPELCAYLIGRMNKECKLSVKSPEFLEEIKLN